MGEPVPCGLTAARQRPYRSCPNDLGTHRVPRREERVATGHAVVEGIEVSTDHWIGGARVSSAETFVDVSPIDEMPIAEVARGGAAEADQAVAAAREGFAVWGSMPPKDRAEVLHRIADGVEARVPELAAVETRDNGSLLRSMRNSVMPRVARNFRFFADHLLTLGDDKDHDGFAEHFEWDPSGVTAVITPWNAPLMLATWRVAPALAAGNAVILKPPEWAPLTASMLADIAHDAGLPDGAFNVLQGIGEEAGAALTAHPGLDRIAFTGSVPTGKLVAQAAAANLTPASLELGGKSPFVAFADADLDAVVAAGGQPVRQRRSGVPGRVRGCSWRRRSTTSSWTGSPGPPPEIVQGDPREAATEIGPQITREHFERVDGFVQRAKADGARAVFGGGPNDELGGLYYRPTLFTDAPAGSEILTQEVFGPVLTLQTFADEDEAVALANDTRYGLAAILYTGDPGRAERVSAELVAGTVWVNCFFVRDLAAPFGGSRNSGIGREGGTWSFDFYSDVKNVCTAPWTT